MNTTTDIEILPPDEAARAAAAMARRQVTPNCFHCGTAIAPEDLRSLMPYHVGQPVLHFHAACVHPYSLRVRRWEQAQTRLYGDD